MMMIFLIPVGASLSQQELNVIKLEEKKLAFYSPQNVVSLSFLGEKPSS
jgi:hypothetical protein